MLDKKWLLLIALPLLVGLSLACGGGSNDEGQGIKIESSSSPGAASLTPGAQGAAPAPAGSPVSESEITTLSSNFAKVKSFKAAINQAGGTTPAVSGTVEFQTPDRIRVSIGAGATSQEIVCIGDQFYFKTGNAEWQKIPASQAGGANCRGNLGPADPKLIGDGITAAAADKSLTKGGQDNVNGKRCQIYAQSLPNGNTFDMCVADGLPIRIVIKAGPQTQTITFSDFDRNIDIKAPV